MSIILIGRDLDSRISIVGFPSLSAKRRHPFSSETPICLPDVIVDIQKKTDTKVNKYHN